ncbi:DUF1622 domain-containing protein [Candidatus Saccharibacteria bacterium]|nr:DUF1622 domain-containing protein [Candidatus Saccharibacteria bacterium]
MYRVYRLRLTRKIALILTFLIMCDII